MTHILVRVHTVLLATMFLILTACGGDSSDDSTTGATTPATTAAGSGSSTTSAESVPAFIDIVTCEATDGSGAATGTITNQGKVAASFHLEIGFYDDANTLLGTGTTDTQTIAAGDSADWTVTATGIGAAEPVCHTVKISAIGNGGATTNSTGIVGNEEFPCDLVALDKVGDLAGNPLDAGDAVTNHIIEDDAQWSAHECSWGSPDAETEVSVAVSRAADFPSDTVECPPLDGSETVTGIGTSAHWQYDDPGTNTTVGVLRVCSDDALIGVTVRGTTSGAEHLKVARNVAQATLTAL